MCTQMGCMSKVNLSIVASMTGLVMEQMPCDYGQRFVFSLLPTCLSEATFLCIFSYCPSTWLLQQQPWPRPHRARQDPSATSLSVSPWPLHFHPSNLINSQTPLPANSHSLKTPPHLPITPPQPSPPPHSHYAQRAPPSAAPSPASSPSSSPV